MYKLPRILIVLLCIIFISAQNIEDNAISQENSVAETKKVQNDNTYKFPEFYRGIYLNFWTGRNLKKLKTFVKKAQSAYINALVIDIQPAKNDKCQIPKENIDYLLKNNIHPIARLVCFDQGLRTWPVSQKKLDRMIKLASSACEVGFKEIQFDYIRFNDSRVLRKLSLEKKYAFIEGFLNRARNELSKYNVKTAADVFGRIPLNKRDIIGQRIESLDKVVDYICPMAYPSHYTWSDKMQKDPYYTVHLTSKRAKERTKKAEIISWIQAFQIKVRKSGLTYGQYIEEQVRATHDSGIRGFLLWNARQDYEVPFKVLAKYYKKKIPAVTTQNPSDNFADKIN